MIKKVVLYNYLYRFSDLESKIKKSFDDYIINFADDDIKNNFFLLHLSEEIKTAFCEDIPSNAFKINRKNLKKEINNIKNKWNLKKRLEFAKNNSFLSEIVPEEIKVFQKLEQISVFDLLTQSIQLRNCFAHETSNITIRRELELLSDDKLLELVSDDVEFKGYTEIQNLDPIYKHGLTYYFYLGVIDSKLP